MATDKTFTVCGVSTFNDGTKVRFANDVMRVKVLAKNGHSDITLVELSTDMSKLDAVNFIKDLPEFQYDAAQQAIDDYLTKYTPKAKVVRKPAKASGPAATQAASELEDAPF